MERETLRESDKFSNGGEERFRESVSLKREDDYFCKFQEIHHTLIGPICN